MEYGLSKTLARIGGALILAGLILPWFKFDLGALGEAFGAAGGNAGDLKITGMPDTTFSAWESARTVFFIVGAFGLLALSQVPFASSVIVGRFFMFAGFAGAVLLGYKIFNPPLDFLSIIDMKLKPQPGIFIALAGMCLAAYGGWEQVKQDLAAPKRGQALGSDWHTTVPTNAGNQGYAQPQATQQYAQAPVPSAQAAAHAVAQHPTAQPPSAAQQVAAPRAVPPDPFAPKPRPPA